MTDTTRKVILITGGSRGIGAATARIAAERGYNVAFSYRSNQQEADRVLTDLLRINGPESALALQADVSVEADIEGLIAKTVEHFGHIDVLVNSAGVVDNVARIDEMSGDRFERMLRINTFGTMVCIREAVKRMSTRHGGRGGAIVNVGSIASKVGCGSEFVDYAASKGAIDSLTEGLSKELGADNIRVNTVRPGVIDTEIHASGGNAEKIAEAASFTPLGRAGRPEEVAYGILWLASDEASFVTGALLDIDGGV